MMTADRSRWLPRTLAILKTALYLRPLGLFPEFGQDVPLKAERALKLLDRPSSRLSWQVGLEILFLQPDLFMEESAIEPVCLKVQMRILELAERFSAVEHIRGLTMGPRTPMGKLFRAVILQAVADRVGEIVIALDLEAGAAFCGEHGISETTGSNTVSVFYRKPEGWMEAMTMPTNLGAPFWGAWLRAQAALEASQLESLYPAPLSLPASLRFEQDSAGLLKIYLAGE